MDINKLLSDIDNNTTELLQALSAFSNEQLNTVPFEGSWTAGQVAEHVLRSETGIPKTLHGTTRPADRPIDEKVAILASIFLDFSSKLKSPDFILPTNEPKDTATMLQAFKDSRHAIREAINTLDMTEICTSWAFPTLGELTRYELVTFALYHSQRHTRQIKNIYKALNQ